MGPACREGEAHIRNGGTGENAQVGLFRQVGQNEPLPVAVQLVLAAGRGEAESAAPGQRLQQQMDLRVVPQRLVVADSHSGGGDSFLVKDAPRAEVHLHSEPSGDEPAQNLQLDLSHETDVDLLQPLVP